jgi:competence protein ComEC
MTPGVEAFHKFPALVLAILVGAGIWIGHQLSASQFLPLTLLTAAATMLLAAMRIWSADSQSKVVCSLCCLLLCPAAGALKYLTDTTPGVLPPSVKSRMMTVIGTVAEAPSEIGNRQRFLLQLRMVIIGDTLVPCAEKGLVTRIRSRGDSAGHSISYGSVVSLHGLVETPPEAGNPGEFSPRQYYNANGISFLMRIHGMANIRTLDSNRGSVFMQRIILPLRRFILAEIDRDIGGEEGEFLKGLLIGERSGLSPGVRRAFLDSGVAHILAVSGSNVAVVAMVILMMLSLLRIPRQVSRALTVAGLLIYMLVTGSQPPVVRATIMATSLLVSSSLTRRVHPLNGVGLSALLMFAIDSRQMFDVGFQLSFGAVLAILVLYPRFMKLLPLHDHKGWAARIGGQIYGVVAVSLAASIGTLPLTAMVFGRLSLVGFLANLAIVPASGVSVVLGLLSCLVAPVSPWVAGAYAADNRIVLLLTIRSAEVAASVPWATIDTVWFRPIDALPFYAGLACLLSLGKPSRLRGGLIALLCALNVSLFWPASALTRASAGEFRVTMIDVGQGDAILLQPPDDRNILIDTGPPPRDGSAWGTSVIPLLKRLGVRSLDAVIITHMHDDHAGGLPYVLKVCEVRQLLIDPVAARSISIPLREARTAVRNAFRGLALGDSIYRLYVVSPDSLPSDSTGNANRLSLVIKLQFGGVSMLFMGDAEQGEEARINMRYGRFLESDVLKVGHHGSRAGTSEEFLRTIRPEYALISVGRTNRFGHPAKSTLQRLQAAGVEVLRTDELGAIVLTTDGKGVHVMQWR